MQPKEANYIYDLDKKVYSEKYLVSTEKTRERLNRNAKTDIVLFTKGIGERSLIGYITLTPVSHRIVRKIINKTASEEEIEEATLAYRSIGKYSLYLSSIVIDKKKYPRIKGTSLLVKMQEHIQSLKRNGVFVETIVANAVSPSGRKTLSRLGFKEINEDVYLYRVKLHDSLWFDLEESRAEDYLEEVFIQEKWISFSLIIPLEVNEWYWDTDT